MFKLRLNRLKKIVVLLNMVINNKKRNYLLAAIWTLTIFFGYKLIGSITAPMPVSYTHLTLPTKA